MRLRTRRGAGAAQARGARVHCKARGTTEGALAITVEAKDVLDIVVAGVPPEQMVPFTALIEVFCVQGPAPAFSDSLPPVHDLNGVEVPALVLRVQRRLPEHRAPLQARELRDIQAVSTPPERHGTPHSLDLRAVRRPPRRRRRA